MPAENVDDTDWALDRVNFINRALSLRHGWCKDDGNWTFGWGRVAYWDRVRWPWAARRLYYFTGWIERVFYTLKAIVCIAWDRNRHYGYWEVENVEVASFAFSTWQSFEYGTVHDWWLLAVGHGLFHNWYYDVYETSSV